MFVRRTIPATAFLAAALFVADAGVGRAQHYNPQSPGKHTPLSGTLTPDEVRRALEPFSTPGPADLPPGLADLLREKLNGTKGVNPAMAEDLLRRVWSTPEFRKKMEDMARQHKESGTSPLPADIERQFGPLLEQQKLLPQIPLPGDGRDQPRPRPENTFPQVPQSRTPDPSLPPHPPAEPPKPVAPRGKPGPGLPPPERRGGPPDLRTHKEDRRRPPRMGGPHPPPPEAGPDGPNPPGGPDNPNRRTAQAFASAWERNIGPLDDAPAVKQAILDLAAGMDDVADAQGNSVWDQIAQESGGSGSLSELIDEAAVGENWTLPKFDLPSVDWNLNGPGPADRPPSSPPGDSWWRWQRPSVPTGGGGGFGSTGGMDTWLPVVVLGVFLAGLFVVWRFWNHRGAEAGGAPGSGGVGGWPIDPRRITTRADLVVAFEYLSVLVCGPVAKTWTHSTIAAALADLAATHGTPALLLARLYELARYAPADEELTTAELAEARTLVCQLAGLEDG